MLKLPTCPEDPKDFPAYEKKVRASLQKFNMHHLLDDGTVTTEDNCEASAKIASALMLSFKTKHIKWFMGSKSTEYEDRGIEMWQHLRAKILDEDDEDDIYDKLLKPKVSELPRPRSFISTNAKYFVPLVLAWTQPGTKLSWSRTQWKERLSSLLTSWLRYLTSSTKTLTSRHPGKPLQ
jgi:uncharacterized protein (DUF1330 family)